ncbi:hypothetical protein COCMIDRAFT_40861 [Bipolaris oryzae ATCC 44560]|uniref:C2H2-type domain-containing protein n=1 Tax=Bipolaris oryzae ATCC 44560 TaxID=930090 RepID=W6YTG1_COCMI|nr:uncharacterized protein COCMIDRAFT_40861 [Bipolaris oryzae ATCC 44560]EUC40885.1 hypothetical protein COCMIDRAFT_40861 [Bipolaris oryzae ATCC 44560]
MAPASADASPSDSLEDQPRENGLVIQPTSKRSYRCKSCGISFPCHEPWQHHANKHGETFPHIHIELKPLALAPDVIALHDVYCRRRTHYVRVTSSTPLGPFSAIQRIDEVEELTFKEFLKRDFTSTENHKAIVRRMEEFDKKCCKSVHERTTFVTKKLVNRLLSCFPCISVPEQSRPSRWPSRPDMRSKSPSQSTKALAANDGLSQHTEDLTLTVSRPSRLHTSLKSPSQSTEAITVNDRRSQDVDDPASTARNSLPQNVAAVVAVASFYSTAKGVHGHEVLVTTHSDTIILLQRVDLDALLQYTRTKKQLQEIVGEYAYTGLLEYRKKGIDIEEPVYQGFLPDDLPIGVGEEVRLEDCSPVLEAEVRSALDSHVTL